MLSPTLLKICFLPSPTACFHSQPGFAVRLTEAYVTWVTPLCSVLPSSEVSQAAATAFVVALLSGLVASGEGAVSRLEHRFFAVRMEVGSGRVEPGGKREECHSQCCALGAGEIPRTDAAGCPWGLRCSECLNLWGWGCSA